MVDDDWQTKKRWGPVCAVWGMTGALGRTKVVSDSKGYITTSFPFEQVLMICGDQRVTASTTNAVYKWASLQTAKTLYDKKGIVPSENFDLIHWKRMGNADG